MRRAANYMLGPPCTDYRVCWCVNGFIIITVVNITMRGCNHPVLGEFRRSDQNTFHRIIFPRD